MLLGELSQRVDGDHELKLINIDGRAEADLAFYRALGAHEITRQWEFERPLLPSHRSPD
jgi:hypothetical protein